MSFDDDLVRLQRFGEVPESITKFYQYMRKHESSLCDFDYVMNGEERALAWFDGDASVSKNYIVFGCTRAGGLFAIWLLEPKDLESCPIVLLASEYTGSSIIEKSFDEWLACLSFGSDDFEIDVQYSDVESWDGPAAVPISLTSFRKWCEAEVGILQAESPASIVVQAVASFPSLTQYIDRWQLGR